MTQAIAAQERSSFGHALADCRVLIRRSMRHLTRNVDEIIQAIALPIMLLLLFRYLFGGAINTGGPSYVNYVIAGVVVLSVAFSATATAVGVANDLQNGIVERFRSMPMFGFSVLVGHVVSSVLRNVLSVILVVGLGMVVGFRPTAGIGEWLAAAGLLVLFMAAISWLATLLGVVAGGVEAASGYAMILVFLPYASSALVPSESMPSVLRAFVDYQPFTPVVNAIRSLLIGTPLGDNAWMALVWWVPILVLTALLTVRVFNRRTRG
ncbi:ABC transporter permease [Kibdelosporangium persicum]|uniref:Transport permease protein n=1 Tax=Kibdelosporangium persicum TaxID=2698649 RepID=A0ABX2F5M1_9PSEU|nr:ABC transporter permease [Kibdelosporangium persicum]NRN66562.1 ABC transporter permease [Kibdelosporangium persicum]